MESTGELQVKKIVTQQTGSPVGSVLECESKKGKLSREWKQLQALERRLGCSGWCQSCNLHILDDSSKSVKPRFPWDGKSCQLQVFMMIHRLMETFHQFLMDVVGLFGFQLILESFKDSIVDEEDKKKIT